MYHGAFSYGETYIGGTVRNMETRWNERNMPSEKLNPSKHLNNNIHANSTDQLFETLQLRK